MGTLRDMAVMMGVMEHGASWDCFRRVQGPDGLLEAYSVWYDLGR
jgi:hypothetical protein